MTNVAQGPSRPFAATWPDRREPSRMRRTRPPNEGLKDIGRAKGFAFRGLAERCRHVNRIPLEDLFQKGSEAALVGWVQPTDFQGLCRWVAPALQPSNQASLTDSDPVGPWQSLAGRWQLFAGPPRHGRRSPGPAGMPCSGARSLERSSHLPSRRGPCGQRSGVTGPRADLG